VTDDDRFIEEYRPLVMKIARQVHHEFTITSPLEDLVANGFKGLVEARSRFDPTRGVQFNTFAYYRIRGAVLDGIREMAYLSRRAHQKRKAAEAASQVLEDLGSGLDQSPAERSKVDAARAIDEAVQKLTATFMLAAVGRDPTQPEPTVLDGIIGREVAEEIRDAVEELPDRERALVRGFYFEGKQFDEVAKTLGISKSWASRLHGKALVLLREALSPDDDP
jgi:RNA polymerase sigma factor FliA